MRMELLECPCGRKMPAPALARHEPVCPGVPVNGKMTCKHCGKPRLVVDFPPYSDARGNRGLRQSACKFCLSERSGRRHARRMRHPVSRREELDYRLDWAKQYYAKNPWARKTRSYQRDDRSRGRKTITMQEARDLIVGASCFYCRLDDLRLLGLDRKNNSDGHHPKNVVVCCEVCNFILSDLAFAAKCVLGRALRRARRLGLLRGYVIPIKRKRK